MEAANLLKRQEASRKESMEMACNKNLENISSPSYDAELNAATASIISLPIDTSSPIITTHADVRFLTTIRSVIKRFFCSRTHQPTVSCISSMKFFPWHIHPMTCAEQPAKFWMAFEGMLKFKSCTQMNFSHIQFWTQVNFSGTKLFIVNNFTFPFVQ